MSRYERAVEWVTDRFEGVEPAYRRDVALTVRDLTGGAGVPARSREFASLVGLALRLRSRHRTASRSVLVWRQGLHLAGVLLLAALAASAWAAAVGPGTVPSLAVALPATAALGCAAYGARRAVVAVVSAVSAVGVAGVAGFLAGPPATTLGACAVAAACLLVGAPTAPARLPRVAAACGSVALGWPLALAAGPGAATTAIAVVLTGIVPAVLIALGWFDPRLAAVGTVLLAWRLMASGPGEFAHAVTVLFGDGRRDLLLRWALMGTGVALAWLVTRRSIRHLSRL